MWCATHEVGPAHNSEPVLKACKQTHSYAIDRLRLVMKALSNQRPRPPMLMRIQRFSSTPVPPCPQSLGASNWQSSSDAHYILMPVPKLPIRHGSSPARPAISTRPNIAPAQPYPATRPLSGWCMAYTPVWKTRSISLPLHQTIADASFGDDVAWLFRVFFDLLSYLSDIDSQLLHITTGTP